MDDSLAVDFEFDWNHGTDLTDLINWDLVDIAGWADLGNDAARTR